MSEPDLYLFHVTSFSDAVMVASGGDVRIAMANFKPEVDSYWAEDAAHAIEQFENESSNYKSVVLASLIQWSVPYDPNNKDYKYVSKVDLNRMNNDE